MTAPRRVNVVAFLVLVAAMACAGATLNAIDRVRVRQAEAEPAVYVTSPAVLRRLCLGYTGLVADIYWTRAVQYFGYQHHRDSGDFRLLPPLLEVATELDPKMLAPYQFGANFLAQQPPKGAGLPGVAVELLKFGVAHNPDQWRLYYNLGFVYFTEIKDYAKAADAFAAGARLPVTNEFMRVLAARMAQHAGEFDTARLLWYTAYQNTKDTNIQANAVQHLVAVRVDEDVTRLEAVVEKYRLETGHPPKGFADLDRAGLIHGTPLDPNNRPYKLTASGRIEVQDPGSIPFISKGLPPGMSPPLPKLEPVRMPSR